MNSHLTPKGERCDFKPAACVGGRQPQLIGGKRLRQKVVLAATVVLAAIAATVVLAAIAATVEELLAATVEKVPLCLPPIHTITLLYLLLHNFFTYLPSHYYQFFSILVWRLVLCHIDSRDSLSSLACASIYSGQLLEAH